MPWRLKYPEASSKRDHYRDLVTTLTANQRAITSSVNDARTIDAALLDPQSVDGEYYNRYIAKRDAWTGIHGQIVAVFDTFLVDLNSCITNASNLQSMWQGRIGVMEEY